MLAGVREHQTRFFIPSTPQINWAKNQRQAFLRVFPLNCDLFHIRRFSNVSGKRCLAGGVGPIPVKSTSSIVAHGDFFPEIDHGNTFCQAAHPRRAARKRKPLEHNRRQTPEWPIWSAGGERAVGLNCRWNSTYDNGCWSAHGGYRSPRLVLEAQWWWQSACVDTTSFEYILGVEKSRKQSIWGT